MQTFRDPESLEDVPLVPGLNKLDNMLRWGFIKKVYGIISAQMVLTVAVASVIIFNKPVELFVTTSAPFQISVFAFSFLGKDIRNIQMTVRKSPNTPCRGFLLAPAHSLTGCRSYSLVLLPEKAPTEPDITGGLGKSFYLAGTSFCALD